MTLSFVSQSNRPSLKSYFPREIHWMKSATLEQISHTYMIMIWRGSCFSILCLHPDRLGPLTPLSPLC